MRRAFVAFALVAFALGCEASIPDRRFECDTDADCPLGQRCDLGRDRCQVPDGGG